MFGIADVPISNVWKSQHKEFQCLERPKFTIPVFGIAKIRNSNIRNSQNSQFHCLDNVSSQF